MKTKLIRNISVTIGVLLCCYAITEAKFWEWQVLESTHFRVYYSKGHLEQAVLAVKELESAIPIVKNTIPNSSSGTKEI